MLALSCAGCGLLLDPHAAGDDSGVDAARASGEDAAVDAARVNVADAPTPDAPTPDAPGLDAPLPPDAFLDPPLDAAMDDAGCGPCMATGPCDEAFCNGSTCEHRARGAETVCNPAVGECDVAEACDGVSDQCPPDRVQPVDTICRDRPISGISLVCDPPERCDGTHAACPGDVSGLDLGGLCGSTGGVCIGEHCVTTADCASYAGTPCQLDCGVGNVGCEAGRVVCAIVDAAPAATLCRPSRGACDAPDVCSGTGRTCPDLRAGSTTVCRPAAGPCDQPELCLGTGLALCPPDVLRLEELCEPGSCRRCSGSSPDCTGEVRLAEPCASPTGLYGVCDPAGACLVDGSCVPRDNPCAVGTLSMGVCTVTSPAPVGTLCESGDGVCTLPSFCTTDGACPAPTLSPAGAPCTVRCASGLRIVGMCGAEGLCDASCPTFP